MASSGAGLEYFGRTDVPVRAATPQAATHGKPARRRRPKTVRSGASAPYNVNYHDYPEELNTAGRHFTLNGWRTFVESYIKSGNYEAMKQGMMLCFAQAQRAAVIVETKILSGALAYRIQFPILQTCQNSQQANTQKMMLTARVVRTNDEDHRDGIAIDQLVAEAK